MKKKLLVTALAVMPILGMFGGNFTSAAVDYDGGKVERPDSTGDYTATEDVKVYVSQPSAFSVIIPKEITLREVSAPKYEEDYTVEVTGNIAGNQTVTVVPAEKVVLLQSGKASITAAVTQDSKTADYDDLANRQTKSLNGTVTANDVTAGDWEGTFKFDISLN